MPVSNGFGSKRSDAEARWDTGAHQNTISAFGESFHTDNEELTRSLSPGSRSEGESLSRSWKETDYLQLEIRGTTLNTDFLKVRVRRLLQYWFSSKLMLVTLKLFTAADEKGNLFLTNETCGL